jgi:hypothetical protein
MAMMQKMQKMSDFGSVSVATSELTRTLGELHGMLYSIGVMERSVRSHAEPAEQRCKNIGHHCAGMAKNIAMLDGDIGAGRGVEMSRWRSLQNGVDALQQQIAGLHAAVSDLERCEMSLKNQVQSCLTKAQKAAELQQR